MVYSQAEGNCLLVAGGSEYVSIAAAVKAQVGVKAASLAWQWSKEGVRGKPMVRVASCLKSKHRVMCGRSPCRGKQGSGAIGTTELSGGGQVNTAVFGAQEGS